MIELCFFFENYDVDVWSGRPMDLDAWFITKGCYQVDKLIVINTTNQTMPLYREGLEEFKTFEEYVDARKDTNKFVYLDTHKNLDSIPMTQYTHPTVDTSYCIGPAAGWKDLAHPNSNYDVVTVEHYGVDWHYGIFIAPIIMQHRWINQ